LNAAIRLCASRTASSTEPDRVFGTEAAYAGTSFLTPDNLEVFRYGPSVVNLTADATPPCGMGTFAWHDEEMPAQRVELAKGDLGDT